MSQSKGFKTTKPTNDQANFLLFSMHGIDGINAYLTNFPKWNPSNPPKAVSATLLWSGQAGYNVNVVTFGDGRIYTGFVLDPNNIEVPQADIRAYNSQGLLETEVKKTEYRRQYDTEFKKSKHPEKKGYDRAGGFETNLARFVRNDNPNRSTYSAVGSSDILSLNIWHKYFKTKEPEKQHDPKNVKHPMNLNEALVFQKGKVNPIAGLFLTGKPDRETANKLKKILEDRPSLKLYLYDIQENKHIVRWFDNDEAKKYLGQFNLDFSRAFARATPFGGENNYRYYATEQSSSRKHLFEAKMPEIGSSVSFQNFKGDYLKTKILNEFQKKIKKITTKTELDALRVSLPENPEYKVLATGQGLTTRLLGLKTSSIAALNEMLDKKEMELNVEPAPNKLPK